MHDRLLAWPSCNFPHIDLYAAVQIRFEIAWKLHVCDAVAWLVVEAAWVQRDAAGRPHSFIADVCQYYFIGILPALIVGYMLEAHARRRFLQLHVDDVLVGRAHIE